MCYNEYINVYKVICMSDNEIKILRGPDRVRKRPAVIFGSADGKGVLNAVKWICDVFFAEARLGYSKKIEITLHKDNSVEIISYDRGLVLEDKEVEGKPAWHWIFCDFTLAPRKVDEAYLKECQQNYADLFGAFDGDTGLDYMSCNSFCFVQYVSEYMRVEAVRGGMRKTLSFKAGYSVMPMKTEVYDGESYTKIHFRADSEVFTHTDFPSEELNFFLTEKVSALEDFDCVLTDLKSGEETVNLISL